MPSAYLTIKKTYDVIIERRSDVEYHINSTSLCAFDDDRIDYAIHHASMYMFSRVCVRESKKRCM